MQMRGADHFRAPACSIMDIWQLPLVDHLPRLVLHRGGGTFEVATHLHTPDLSTVLV